MGGVPTISSVATRVRFLNTIEADIPAGKIVHGVLDNDATHKHTKVRAWLDRHPPLCLPLYPDLGLLAQRGRGLLRQIDQTPPQTRGPPLDCRSPGRHQPLLKETNDHPKPFVWTADPDKIIAAVKHGYQTLIVDDPVEARAIWYVAPRSGAVMCPAYVARP
jgi:hypothetical protein